MAEREGFEPSVRVYPGQLLSRQPCSATPAPLRKARQGGEIVGGTGAGVKKGVIPKCPRPATPSPGIEIPGYPQSPLPGLKSRTGRSSVARDFNPGRRGHVAHIRRDTLPPPLAGAPFVEGAHPWPTPPPPSPILPPRT